MAALGDEFRAAREARGLSLEEVHERIHLRPAYLEAIEAEDWATIGEPVYVRGFIRTYARFLGLDGERAVAQFSAKVPTAEGSAPARTVVPAADYTARRSSPLLVILGVIAVALVAFVGYRFYEGRQPAIVQDVAATPQPAATKAAAAAAVGDDATDAQPTPVPTKKPAVKNGLQLAVTQTSWVEIVIDGGAPIIATYPPGTKKTFHGKRAYVRAGNAGGVRVTVNGKDIGKLGASGDVVERTFTLAP